ncbi:uncharacterized protein BCR38DRAFT_242063 [Pseudomassariella vexata]|uniref:Uncharacterized protein n=1 Tax=Pseudomassariella vexata TaxID=1141098 RepID=A0A1Y2DTS1_9PEZI|nr:uncharacterized protein BCR38DRAFT_242063 [Pseudomassariella vexata]ORY62536.1 hypothetical protein BCR38DRAFT_242063 [Pseudomassariella vexata]
MENPSPPRVEKKMTACLPCLVADLPYCNATMQAETIQPLISSHICTMGCMSEVVMGSEPPHRSQQPLPPALVVTATGIRSNGMNRWWIGPQNRSYTHSSAPALISNQQCCIASRLSKWEDPWHICRCTVIAPLSACAATWDQLVCLVASSFLPSLQLIVTALKFTT